jgi:hypothetical protein
LRCRSWSIDLIDGDTARTAVPAGLVVIAMEYDMLLTVEGQHDSRRFRAMVSGRTGGSNAIQGPSARIKALELRIEAPDCIDRTRPVHLSQDLGGHTRPSSASPLQMTTLSTPADQMSSSSSRSRTGARRTPAKTVNRANGNDQGHRSTTGLR